MLLLIPSYYSSYVRGEHYLNEKTYFTNCFSLYPNPDCLERMLHWDSNHDDNFLPMINYLIENDLSLFGESRLNNEDELLKKFQNFDHLPQISSINNFEYINENKIIDTSRYVLDSEILSMNGWFLIDSNSIPKNLFLLLDEKPILENETFEIEYDSKNDSKTKISWSVFFLSGYLEIGCHEIHLVGITEHEKINLENTLVVCKNS